MAVEPAQPTMHQRRPQDPGYNRFLAMMPRALHGVEGYLRQAWDAGRLYEAAVREFRAPVPGQVAQDNGLDPTRFTDRELAVLTPLLTNPGEWVSFKEILAVGWGAEAKDQHHLLMVHAARLRPKLVGSPWRLESLTGKSCYRVVHNDG